MPAGNYLFTIKSHTFGKSRQKQTPEVQFTVIPTNPLPDVNQEELAAVKNWQTREMRVTFWFTDDALWRLDKFLLDCGIQDKLPREETIPMTTGRQFVGTVSHSQGQQGQTYANITDTAPNT